MTEGADDKKLSSDRRFHLWIHVIDRVTSIILLLIKAGMLFVVVWGITVVFQALSGKQTDANINVNVNTETNFFVNIWSNIDVSVRWAWLITIFSILYGLLQQELRRRKTAYLQARITKLEKMIDPSRSSSRLTERGETGEEDRL